MQMTKYNWAKICFNMINDYLPKEFDEYPDRNKFVEIVKHAEIVVDYVNKTRIDIKIESIVDVARRICYGYNITGDYKNAITSGKNALFLCDNDLHTQQYIYNQIALSLFYQGKYKAALASYSKSYKIIDKIFGEYSKQKAELLNNKGLVYRRLGQYKYAIDQYMKSLNIRKQQAELDLHSIAETYNNIGVAYYHDEDFGNALQWHLKALKIRKSFSNMSADIAETYNNIGVVYIKMDMISKALRWLRRAMIIRERVLGKYHPDITMTYDNIAACYAKTQINHALAIEWFDKALEIRKEKLGENHPDVAQTYNNKAYVYKNLGELKIQIQEFEQASIYLKTALELYNFAYKIFLRVYGEHHSDTLTVLQNLNITNDLIYKTQ